jgi:4-hydroxybenzoate polyprenyltransferase
VATASTLRAWLVLSRLSNLPTVWTNVIAGGVVAGAAADRRLAGAALAISLMYVGGMMLNDVCDAHHDRAHRVRRPIPAGVISRTAAALAASVLMLAGLLIVNAVARSEAALAWALGLVAAIAYYDVWHKADPAAPLGMGDCRGLVYAVAAATAAGIVPSHLWPPAAVLTVYVAAFTFAARHVPAVRPWVSWCIAAISLVDAGVLVWAGSPALAIAAICGVPLTLLWQRVVPGD